jgi:hypothetical protein
MGSDDEIAVVFNVVNKQWHCGHVFAGNAHKVLNNKNTYESLADAFESCDSHCTEYGTVVYNYIEVVFNKEDSKWYVSTKDVEPLMGLPFETEEEAENAANKIVETNRGTKRWFKVNPNAKR